MALSAYVYNSRSKLRSCGLSGSKEGYERIVNNQQYCISEILLCSVPDRHRINVYEQSGSGGAVTSTCFLRILWKKKFELLWKNRNIIQGD